MARFIFKCSSSVGVHLLTTWIGGGLSLYKTQERGLAQEEKELGKHLFGFFTTVQTIYLIHEGELFQFFPDSN